ncbi:MAG: hypothetical protein HYY96_12480 [Candidatus Tectomicrobia bacterium]|nr:hypothetical protein [Candidatus Tectomicrobia bacterium]
MRRLARIHHQQRGLILALCVFLVLLNICLLTLQESGHMSTPAPAGCCIAVAALPLVLGPLFASRLRWLAHPPRVRLLHTSFFRPPRLTLASM